MSLKKKLLKKFSKKKEADKLLVEDSGESLEWLMEKELDEYGADKIAVDRATLKAISRRSNWVKILRFLYSHSGRDFSCKEIYKAIKLPYMTCHYALQKMTKAKILQRIVPFNVDTRIINYRIRNLQIVGAIIRLHDRFVSFKLVKTLSFDQVVPIQELKKNSEFLKLCRKYRLTADEAVEALKSSRKIKIIYCSSDGNREVFGLQIF